MKNLIALAEAGRINEEANIRDRQSTIINARVEDIWIILLDIEGWPKWNPKISDVHVNQVHVGQEFKWKCDGQKSKSIFRKIKQQELVVWTGLSNGKKMIHTWKFEAIEGNQTIVTTEQSLEGIKTIFYSHQKLHSTLLHWLSSLKQCAEEKSI